MMGSEIRNIGDERRIELIASHIEEIIKLIGEDVSREGLIKTPVRAAKALDFITQGYRNNSEQILQSAMFTHEGSQVVIVKDIEFYSMCEHHILPFFGKVSIAYLPGKHIVGLSKLARLVNNCARKLQVQERLTREICTIVGKVLDCEGVMVVCEAQHLCMKMRGVEKQDSSTATMEYTGRFVEDNQLRRDVLDRMK